MARSAPKPVDQQEDSSNRSRFAAVALTLGAVILVGVGLASAAYWTFFPAFVVLIAALNIVQSRRNASTAGPGADLEDDWAQHDRMVHEGRLFGTGPYAFLGEDIETD